MQNLLQIKTAFILILILQLSLCKSFLYSQNIPAQANDIKFEILNSEDGLSYNKVQCILQDSQGYLWFGTVNGLNRYDGYSFRVYSNSPGDSATIAGNDIVSLYQDNEGIIWIGGVISSFSAYNPRTETFKNYAVPNVKTEIHDFLEDENRLMWIATGAGLFSFERKENKLIFHATDDSARENIHGILQDANKDILWLSTETGFRKFNKKTGAVKKYSIAYPGFADISREITHNIIEDNNGGLWMSTTNQGVYQLNPQTEKLTRHEIDFANAFPSQGKTVTRILKDSNGKILLCGDGLAVFDPLQKSFTFYNPGIEDSKGIPAKIRTVLKDKNDIYWIGTERGIAKYDPRLNSFQTVKPNPPYTLPSANTIIEDADHNYWVGNYIGLCSVDINTGIYTNKNELLGSKNFLYSSAADNKGGIWFGSSGCIFHLQKMNNAPGNLVSEKITPPVSAGIQITSLAFDARGLLWMGTDKSGLISYDAGLKKFKTYTGEINGTSIFPATSIKVLQILNGNKLLIGTRNAGVVLMNTETGKFEKIQLNKNSGNADRDYFIVNSICEDRNNNIWIGMENGGLYETDTSLASFRHYTIKDGLQSMNILQIIEGDAGQIWLNTDIGLEIIDPKNKRFVQYSEKDGLSIYQTQYLFKTSSGNIIRIDDNGFHIFNPSGINLNKNIPVVYINHLKVLDRDIPVYGDTSIHLAYNENYFSFDYVALNYTQSFKNRYQYKLTGLDENWIDAGNRRFTSYANVGRGTYTFEVKGSNNEGVWNEKPARVTLIISPPWWNTWWFYILAISLVSAIIYMLFQYRLKQKLTAIELRNRISRDLHDEVGSTLSSIGFLSSMALNDFDSANAKAYKTLTTISESSGKMLDAMSDIIWSIQPQNDSLENIIARMISFASELLEARKIALSFRVSNDIKHMHLGIAVRHDFFVIFKEAVNNIAKYSEASEVFIQLDFQAPYLVLFLKDNGKGFDQEKVTRGNGLKNMKNRAEKMNALYRLHSTQGEGTAITLQVKPS